MQAAVFRNVLCICLKFCACKLQLCATFLKYEIKTKIFGVVFHHPDVGCHEN